MFELIKNRNYHFIVLQKKKKFPLKLIAIEGYIAIIIRLLQNLTYG